MPRAGASGSGSRWDGERQGSAGERRGTAPAHRSRVARKKTLRVFVSSPGDVAEERVIADRVISRVSDRYASILSLEAIIWEHEPLQATGSFQEQITRPSETDIFVCILWSRLGTRLPGSIRRPDGTLYQWGPSTSSRMPSRRTAVRGAGRDHLFEGRRSAAAEPHRHGRRR